MGVWFVPLIYIAILIESPLLLGLSFGLSVQSEVALLYHLIPIIILGYRKFSIKKIGLAVFVFLLAVSPMIMSELKFGFEGVKSWLTERLVSVVSWPWVRTCSVRS
jgi:uncharacterized membrane protein